MTPRFGQDDGETMLLGGLLELGRTLRAESWEAERLEMLRSNAALEAFACVAAHELKAPLRGMGQLVAWLEEAESVSETVEHLRGLRGRMARLQGMVDGLLAQARLSHGPAVAETVDVAILVREVTSLLAPPAGFSIVCVGPMVALHTERAPLALVLRNLIGNAIGHHDRDIGVVTVAMRRRAGLAEFVVTDDGPGIPARFHARIFEKFQAVAGSDARTGGMGLALATAAVAAQGGTIRVESAPPIRGSRFVFTWRADAG